MDEEGTKLGLEAFRQIDGTIEPVLGYRLLSPLLNFTMEYSPLKAIRA